MKSYVASAAFALFACTAAHADDIIPKELQGQWGGNPSQCRAFHRKVDDIKHIRGSSITSCSGVWCEIRIVKAKKIGDQYRLTALDNEGGKFKITFNKIENNVLEETFEDGASPETLVRCEEADKIAGIGFPEYYGLSDEHDLDAAFGAYYAIAGARVCPSLRIDIELANRYAEIGISEGFKRIAPTAPLNTSEQSLRASQQSDAEYAVSQDLEAIPNFCDHLLDAYGEGGRIYEGLLSDTSRRS